MIFVYYFGFLIHCTKCKKFIAWVHQTRFKVKESIFKQFNLIWLDNTHVLLKTYALHMSLTIYW